MKQNNNVKNLNNKVNFKPVYAKAKHFILIDENFTEKLKQS